MATAPRRTGGDVAAPAPFSYAQAAKGLSTTPSVPSKPSSGSVTPAKEAQSLPTNAPAAAVMSWADDAEANDSRPEKLSNAREPRTQPPPSAPKQSTASQPSTTSIVSSPDLGASSASTVTKDDDVSSIPNTSSDSTWENKSQASTSVDKSAEPTEKTSEKGKGKNADSTPPKPLQEAPVPVVNIWKQRAEEAKAKAVQKPNTAKPAAAAPVAALPNGLPQGPQGPMAKQVQGAAAADSTDGKAKAVTYESRPKGREEEKAIQARKDAKADAEPDRSKKAQKGRPQEKEAKPAQSVLPLPPDRDQEAWPTPETALDENRKKAQEKTGQSDKERKDGSSTKSGGKKEWVNMAITPNVIFNTPLPNGASRRGGRGMGRGGAQSGGRAAVFSSEKDGSATAALPNGEQPRRGRPDGSARDASPKEKRTVSAGSLNLKDKAPALSGEKSSRAAASEADAPSRRASVMTEPGASSHISGQNNTFPRQYPSGRPNKGRRGEIPSQGDRRKDSELVSPTKENGVPNDRRTSVSTQTEGG